MSIAITPLYSLLTQIWLTTPLMDYSIFLFRSRLSNFVLMIVLDLET